VGGHDPADVLLGDEVAGGAERLEHAREGIAEWLAAGIEGALRA
jgi:hypothetical protein